MSAVPAKGDVNQLNWRKTALDVATIAGPPSAVATVGWLLSATYGGEPQVAEWVIAAVAAVVAIRARESAIKWGGLAVFGACVQASVVGVFGFDLAGLTATGLAMAGCAAARVSWNLQRRLHGPRRSLEGVRLETAQIRAQIAYKRLDKLNEPEPEPPNLIGRNSTESDVRQAVWDVFGRELLGCDAHSTQFGWQARVQLPPDLDRARVGRDWGRVASAMGVPGNFEIGDGHNSNELEVRYVDNDQLQEPVPYATQDDVGSFRDPMRLGQDGFGTKCFVDMAYNHTLIGGSSKFGKSGLVKLIGLRLAPLPDAVIYGVDMKPGAPELTLMRPILQDLASTVEQAKAMFEWLTSEMHRRGEILARTGDTHWDPHKHGAPAIYIIVDELAELTRQGDNVGRGEIKMSQRLESLLALARAYALHLILSTQQPSNRVFGKSTDARGNLTNRICVRMNDPGHGRFMFGGGGWNPASLDLPGKFLIQSPDHGQPWPYRAEWVNDEIGFGEVERLGRERVQAPIGNRLILPADQRLGNQERVLERLGNYGPMTRAELEIAAGLDQKQTLRALSTAKPKVERDETAGENVWRLVDRGFS